MDISGRLWFISGTMSFTRLMMLLSAVVWCQVFALGVFSVLTTPSDTGFPTGLDVKLEQLNALREYYNLNNIPGLDSSLMPDLSMMPDLGKMPDLSMMTDISLMRDIEFSLGNLPLMRKDCRHALPEVCMNVVSVVYDSFITSTSIIAKLSLNLVFQ